MAVLYNDQKNISPKVVSVSKTRLIVLLNTGSQSLAIICNSIQKQTHCVCVG